MSKKENLVELSYLVNESVNSHARIINLECEELNASIMRLCCNLYYSDNEKFVLLNNINMIEIYNISDFKCCYLERTLSITNFIIECEIYKCEDVIYDTLMENFENVNNYNEIIVKLLKNLNKFIAIESGNYDNTDDYVQAMYENQCETDIVDEEYFNEYYKSMS